MNLEKSILDNNEVIKSKRDQNYVFGVIEIMFFLSILTMFYLGFRDDYGFFLPKGGFINVFTSDTTLHLQNDIDERFSEMGISLLIILYFFFMGACNFLFWKNGSKRKFRIIHSILSIGLIMIGYHMMTEDDILQSLKISTSMGKQQFLLKAKIVYILLFCWLILQIVYIKVLLKKIR